MIFYMFTAVHIIDYWTALHNLSAAHQCTTPTVLHCTQLFCYCLEFIFQRFNAEKLRILTTKISCRKYSNRPILHRMSVKWCPVILNKAIVAKTDTEHCRQQLQECWHRTETQMEKQCQTWRATPGAWGDEEKEEVWRRRRTWSVMRTVIRTHGGRYSVRWGQWSQESVSDWWIP